jgi:hypothetical protein
MNQPDVLTELTVTLPFTLRYHQSQIDDILPGKRSSVLVCHRRFGKTVLAIVRLVWESYNCQKPSPRFAYIAPLRNQAKAVAWDYLRRCAGVIPGVSFNESELRCDFPNGARITLYGADNPDALRGLYLDGVVIDEVAQMPPRLMSEIITPALLDRNGWRLLIGTPSGHNVFYEAFQMAKAEMQAGNPDWYAGMYRASETGILPPNALADARKQMTPEQYEQEFECSFEAAILGAYYGKELAQADREGRICAVPVEPSLPVHTAWDLGQADATSIWFYQIVRGGSLRLVDYYEASGVGFDHYAKVLFTDKRYLYGAHTAPHDIRVREFSGKSRLETAAALGINFQIAPQMGLQDGIDAARMLISRCWFDAAKCGPGIEALKLYRQDQSRSTGTWTGKPVHDWTSHASDAFRYLAVCPDVAFESARNTVHRDTGGRFQFGNDPFTDLSDYDPLRRAS